MKKLIAVLLGLSLYIPTFYCNDVQEDVAVAPDVTSVSNETEGSEMPEEVTEVSDQDQGQ